MSANAPLPKSTLQGKLAGQTPQSLIGNASSPPGIVTLGKANPNFTGYPHNNPYTEDQENKIPSLLHPVNSNTNNNNNRIDLTKEQSIESSSSSTSEYLKSIEKSHEEELCILSNDDNQRIYLLEANEYHNLCDIFSTGFMTPSLINYFEWNWWNMNDELIKYYKNEITFLGPNVYLGGPIYNGIYPLLRATNFDSIDFEYPLKYIMCHLSENHGLGASMMTDIVYQSIHSEILNHHHLHSINNGGNRFSRHSSRRHHIDDEEDDDDDDNDDDIISDVEDAELEKEINGLHIKFGVCGSFISKPYNDSCYHSDGSFDVNLYFNFNIDCIENECGYNVYIFPSHPQNRRNCQQIMVDNGACYHSLNGELMEEIHGTLRIYPEIMTMDEIQENNHHDINAMHDDDNNNNNNHHHFGYNQKQRHHRKRNRSQIIDEEDIKNNHNDLNIMPSIPMSSKRRKLNDESALYLNEEKQEFEHKTDENNTTIQQNQQQKRFKNKTSNRRKSNKSKRTVQRHGGMVSVTVDKKSRFRNNNNHNNNNNNNHNHNNHNHNNVERENNDINMKKNKNNNHNKPKINGDAKYRGYFIAIFVPRSSELYPFCSDSINLQPFIRGQIIFYDGIHADQAKPNKENYQWLIQQIITTYKKKGKNIKEFDKMRYEYEQIKQIYNDNSNRSGSIVFDHINKQQQQQQKQQQQQSTSKQEEDVQSEEEDNNNNNHNNLNLAQQQQQQQQEQQQTTEQVMEEGEVVALVEEPSSTSPQAPDSAEVL